MAQLILLFLFFSHAETIRVRTARAVDHSSFSDIQVRRFVDGGLGFFEVIEGQKKPFVILTDKLKFILKNANVLLYARSETLFDEIQTLDMDRYLEGVLFNEMPMHYPKEALKAQAIISKSYAKSKISSHKTFDVENTVEDQIYKTATHSKEARSILNQVRAVVLEDHNQKIAQTLFHAHCGGAKDKGSCRLKAHWKFSISDEELMAKLQMPQKLKNVFVTERSSNGRALKVNLLTQDKKNLKLSGEGLRRLIGFEKLKSSLFELSFKDHRIDFEGYGYGHGLGLCQNGARALAQGGLNYRQILEHYYPKFRLRNDRDQHPNRKKNDCTDCSHIHVVEFHSKTSL